MDNYSKVTSVFECSPIFYCRRVDSSLEFYDKTWREYKSGFDNGLFRNLWLGNDRIHVLSTKNNADVLLRIELFGDRRTHAPDPNMTLYGEYNFSVVY